MSAWVISCLVLASIVYGEDVLSTKSNLDTLRYVHAVWRHGDRTPSTLIPTDINNGIETWPDGLGELTVKGEAQQYQLGKLLRERYDGFLDKKYSPFQIYIRSSDYNRTLASAQANLIGLFPPEDQELFDKGLRWRPIPVHTIPKVEDRELFDRVACPHADAEENAVYSSDEVKKIEEENHDFLVFLAKQSGLEKEVMRLRDLWKLFDPLMAEHSHPEDHKLPAWVNETVQRDLWRLYDVSSFYLYGSPVLKRLRCGPLFSAIIGRMDDVAHGRRDQREKLYAYSAHDTAVAALLAAFGVTPAIFPEYATMALVELHKINETDIVKLFYKNHTHNNNIYELEIPQCAAPCTLHRLKLNTANVIPRNWEEECGLYQRNHKDNIIIYVGVTIMLFVILVLIAFGQLRYHRNLQKQNQTKYSLLNEDIDF
ncbi:unnamed protein product [Bursaphelenchus xylophilus]|uniref:(pine wood nematode) hypothetical protein n=1 Tax=Bursaphelenchus xylophilus TaxID=6326 RepID=A0A1I7SQS3_BURXY|nr:unnamed protein product [Bursaphelenchus xylophilus]CAG9110316.1 unnamed protein product [Bursaphelenchus xylophilus]